MAYEYPTPVGVVALRKGSRGWVIEFQGRQFGQWASPDAAAAASCRQRAPLPDWDRARLQLSDDLLRWRPLGESL